MEGKTMSENYRKPSFTSNYFEYEKNNTPISVIGRLKLNIEYWKGIGTSDYILSVIDKGYVIPVTDVQMCFLRNNLSARQEPKFVRESIDELLSTVCNYVLIHTDTICANGIYILIS